MINSEEEREKICSRLRRLGGRQLGSDGSWCELHQLFKCEASAELEDVSHPVLTRIITGGRGVTRVVQYWGGEYRREEKTTLLMSLTIVLKCLSPDAGGDLPSLSQSAISQLEGPDNLENVAFPSKIILDTDVDEEKKSKAVDPTDGYDKSRVTQKEELAAALSLVGSLGYKFFTAYTKKGFVYEILSGTPITAEVVKLVPEDPTDTGPLENSSWLFTLRCAGGEVEESHLISLAMLLDEPGSFASQLAPMNLIRNALRIVRKTPCRPISSMSRTITVSNLVHSQSKHTCLCTPCPHCISMMGGSRSFASSAVPEKKGVTSSNFKNEKNGLTRIAKAIGKEIDFQKELASSDECKTVEQVLSSHQRLIKDHNIQVEVEGDQGTLMMTVDGDVSFVLKFDCSHVADCHSNAMQENEEESQIVEDDFEADEFEDEPSEMGSMPFHLEVEIRRSNLHDKFLNLELEVSPDLEEKQKYSLFLSDISVDNVDGESSYRGPQIDSLDEEIRDTIEEFAKKNLAKVIPLIVDYSVATDDANYINWLQNAKEIVS